LLKVKKIKLWMDILEFLKYGWGKILRSGSVTWMVSETVENIYLCRSRFASSYILPKYLVHAIEVLLRCGNIPHMITAFTNDVALQMGIKLDSVDCHKGSSINCLDAHLLHLQSGKHLVSCIVYTTEYDDVTSGLPCEPLEMRLMSAMSRLKMMLEP
jgi:hypothetical protein